MQPTTLTLHTQYQIGEVDPRIFGGFLEHMGRAVYQGVYEPKSAHADTDKPVFFFFSQDIFHIVTGCLFQSPGHDIHTEQKQGQSTKQTSPKVHTC